MASASLSLSPLLMVPYPFGLLSDVYPGSVFTFSHGRLLHLLAISSDRHSLANLSIDFPIFLCLCPLFISFTALFSIWNYCLICLLSVSPLTWPPRPSLPDATLQEGRKQGCLFSSHLWTYTQHLLCLCWWVNESHFFLHVATEQWELAIPGTKSQPLHSVAVWPGAKYLNFRLQQYILQGSFGDRYVK